jgi:hypothetical protein
MLSNTDAACVAIALTLCLNMCCHCFSPLFKRIVKGGSDMTGTDCV